MSTSNTLQGSAMMWHMCYHALRWIGSGSSACMQHLNPCHWPISGNTGEGMWVFPNATLLPLLWHTLVLLVLPLHSFPSHSETLLLGALAAFTVTAPSVLSTVVTHGPFSIYFRASGASGSAFLHLQCILGEAT